MDFLKFLAVFCSIVLFLLFGLIRGLMEISTPGELAAIEQLRSDVLRVGTGASEDVIGQVTEWNQNIRSNQRYRNLWWSRLLTPKEWDNVDVIEIP
jgi:hypothetical protein